MTISASSMSSRELASASRIRPGSEARAGLADAGAASGGAVTSGADLFDVAPNHEANQFVSRGRGDLARARKAPVLQYRDAVADGEDLRQPVRNIDDRHAVRL